MRQIVLDTETTGLDVAEGHRIIEIGCIELIRRQYSGNNWHRYLCPQRKIDPEALKIHGLDEEFLSDQPKFAEIAAELLDYCGDAELIIHNAPFDLAFLNAEFRMIYGPSFKMEDQCSVLDTLVMARQYHPGARNNLDALKQRYAVSRFTREAHGAFLDAEILADVYLAMTQGQGDFLSTEDKPLSIGQDIRHDRHVKHSGQALPVLSPTSEEESCHNDYCAMIERQAGYCLWRQYEK